MSNSTITSHFRRAPTGWSAFDAPPPAPAPEPRTLQSFFPPTIATEAASRNAAAPANAARRIESIGGSLGTGGALAPQRQAGASGGGRNSVGHFEPGGPNRLAAAGVITPWTDADRARLRQAATNTFGAGIVVIPDAHFPKLAEEFNKLEGARGRFRSRTPRAVEVEWKNIRPAIVAWRAAPAIPDKQPPFVDHADLITGGVVRITCAPHIIKPAQQWHFTDKVTGVYTPPVHWAFNVVYPCGPPRFDDDQQSGSPDSRLQAVYGGFARPHDTAVLDNTVFYMMAGNGTKSKVTIAKSKNPAYKEYMGKDLGDWTGLRADEVAKYKTPPAPHIIKPPLLEWNPGWNLGGSPSGRGSDGSGTHPPVVRGPHGVRLEKSSSL